VPYNVDTQSIALRAAEHVIEDGGRGGFGAVAS